MNLIYLIKILFVLFFAEVTAITVKPCPTNKIAPHRRSPRYSKQSRTFGHIFSLFADEDQGSYGGSQEAPQADDPNDCGDIEDYDENDLSSVTRNQRKQNKERFFFHPMKFFFGHDQKPTVAPTRPPPGGYFGTNAYRPQMQLNPSDHLKPVHEYNQEPQMLYKPGLVGATLGHIVGVQQVQTTRKPLQNKDLKHNSSEPAKHRNKHPKTRHIQDTGVFRSFVDLLF